MRIDHEGAEFPYRQLANLLRAAIKSGRYPPGRRIPSVRALMRDTGMGGMTVQRAIHVLVEEGLLYTVPGRGTFVMEPKPLVAACPPDG
jgi:GntR family transcriptional regulator